MSTIRFEDVKFTLQVLKVEKIDRSQSNVKRIINYDWTISYSERN